MNQEATRELTPAERRKYIPKPLWSSEQMAVKVYNCDQCNREPIFPGETYRRTVYVQGERMFVKREHIPACPWDPDEEERFIKESDRIHAEYEAKEREQAAQETREAA